MATADTERMRLREITGDLFTVDTPAIGHGVNCRGLMASGIAAGFAERWPTMVAEYQARCAARMLQPGGVFPWRAPDGRIVLNMATQDAPGANATLDLVERASRIALWYCDELSIPELSIPRIGSGIGGLAWPDVREILKVVSGDFEATLTVVSLPARERSSLTVV